jgi:class 3 adenylate cyclase/tetratricopeptide (TPR) repeat protein
MRDDPVAVPGVSSRQGPNDLLTPYVPRLLVEWLANQPDSSYRAVEGTCVFADVSGFTNLTERLARRGKAGAEEMSDVLNVIFEPLLGAAYEFGAGLVKWGGDAVLLLFDSEGHAARACRASFEMQRVMRRLGRVQTSVGPVRLRMSIGVHSGSFDFFLVGRDFKELVIAGPGATELAQMEKQADATEVVVSGGTVACLGGRATAGVGLAKGSGWLLAAAPDAAREPDRDPVAHDLDLGIAFCEPLRRHLLAGGVEPEHRHVTVAFLTFEGSDDLRIREGAARLTDAVSHFVETCQEAASSHSLTFLASDIQPDGAKVILIAGVPGSAGDNEARILSAVRSVVDAGGMLPVKAGVNSGRVFAGDYGPAYRRVYSIAGDIVNVAARLMAKAEPGQVLARPWVVERSRTRFHTEALEPFSVKGKSELMTAVLVGPVTDLGWTGAHVDHPLLGREREMAVLRSAAAAAARGGGQVVEMIGPPGIGKSRLLREVASEARGRVIWVDGDIYATATPYRPFHRVFRTLLGLEDAADDDQVVLDLTQFVADAAPDLLGWLPLVGIAAGLEFPMTDEVRAIDTEARKERLEWATSEVLGALLGSPTVLIFNDVHFMDEASVDLIRHVASGAGARPWLIVASRRPGSRTVADAHPNAEVLELSPLDGAAAAQLLAAVTEAAPLPAHRLDALVERAAGNPLFLLELNAGAFGADSTEELPGSVEDVIAARIDRLEPGHRRALRSAAVLGMDVDPGLLDAVLRVDHGESAFTRWDELAEFVSPDADGTLRFAHHLVRETAYAGLAFRRRAILHARVVDVLELTHSEGRADEVAALLSLHSFFGERFDAAWAYSRRAGDLARRIYAVADAAELYRRALAAAGRVARVNDDDYVSVCESLSTCYDDLGEFEPAEAVLAQARRRAGRDRLQSARLALKTSTIRQRLGNYPVALSWLSKGLRNLEGLEDDPAIQIRGTLMTRYAWIRIFQGKPRSAIRWAERALAEAQRCDDRATVAHCLEIVEWGGIGLGEIPVESPAARALEIYVELDDVAGQASIFNTLGNREYFRGNWDQAIGHYRSAETCYRTSGSLWGTVMPMASRAELLSDQGHQTDAEELAAEALRVARSAHYETDVAFATYLLGRIATRSGRLDEAVARYEAARTYYRDAGVEPMYLLVVGLEAEWHLHQDEPDVALQKATDALHRARQLGGMETTIPMLERFRGRALIDSGAVEAGRAELLESVERARARGTMHEIAFGLAELVATADDDLQATSWRPELQSLNATLGIVAAARSRTRAPA